MRTAIPLPVPSKRAPWNKGRLIGQKCPLKPKDVWAIRVRLQLRGRKRDLALFNLAIDSKLRGCDLIAWERRDEAISADVFSTYIGAGIARWLYMILRICARSLAVRVLGSTRRSLPVSMPRLTAGRLPTSSNQRLKYLNSLMS
jgi:hypothetical protein